MENGFNYSNLAQSQILFYMYQWPMEFDHGAQYESNLSSHHRGMQEDGQTNGLMDRLID